MEEEYVYILLELSYAKKYNITKGEKYTEELKKVLPLNWYMLASKERIIILNEALETGKLAIETESYKDLYSKDAVVF